MLSDEVYSITSNLKRYPSPLFGKGFLFSQVAAAIGMFIILNYEAFY